MMTSVRAWALGDPAAQCCTAVKLTPYGVTLMVFTLFVFAACVFVSVYLNRRGNFPPTKKHWGDT